MEEGDGWYMFSNFCICVNVGSTVGVQVVEILGGYKRTGKL